MYDFEHIVDRSRAGSSKWLRMLREKPDVAPGIPPLSTADIDLPLAPEIAAGLRDFLPGSVIGYSLPTPEYREAVGAWLASRHSWQIELRWIQDIPGVVAGFYTAINALTEPGDGVIIQTPAYYPFFSATRGNDRLLLENPLRPVGTTYELDLDDLKRQASHPRAKVLLFCSPHNPTGRVWRRDELEAVADICLRHDLTLISDEIHFDLVQPGSDHIVTNRLSDEVSARTIFMSAPSKSFNLAGFNHAYAVIPDTQLRRRFRAQLHSTGFHQLTLLGYVATRLAYERAAGWLDELNALVSRNHLAVKAALADRFPDVVAYDIQGTFLQWLDLRPLGIDADEVDLRLHANDVFLEAGHVFGEASRGFQRMNIAGPTEVMLAAVDRMATALAR